MRREQVLIVGSNMMLCRFTCERIAAMEIDVHYVKLSAEALIQFTHAKYCLVIIDARMLNQTHLDLIKQMRQAKPTPILVLSDSFSPDDKLQLLQSGANAFIEEPFNIDICIAQAYALIQLHANIQAESRSDSVIYGTELIISKRYRQVMIDGKPLELTRKEFDLFHHFANHPGPVFNCEQLYDHVWNEEVIQGSDSTVKSHIKTLRKKLALAGKKYIQNVWGVGYKFEPSEDK